MRPRLEAETGRLSENGIVIAMLSVVRWWAIVVGLAAGILTVALVNLLGALALAPTEVADPALAARPVALLLGFVAGGGVAARFAPVAGRFHGAIAALAMAGLVIVVAGQSGSPLPISQVLLLIAFALVLGGFTGWWVDRRKVE